MMRKRITWEKPLGWSATALMVGALLLGGCGEQDLYKPPHSPYQIAGRLPLESSPEDVDVMGTTAYLAGGQAGLYAVDISNPSAPVLIDVINTKKYAESIKVRSVPSATGIIDIAFVVEGTEGVTTYDVSRPDSIYSFQQGTTAVDGNGLFIDISDNPSEPYVVYLAENWKGVRVFESDPVTPGLLRYNGVFSGTRGYAKSIALEGGFAYVADDELGVAVLDVSVLELGEVEVVSWCDTDGESRGICVDGGYAYVADGENGLVVMSLHGGDPPATVGHLPLGGVCRAIEYRDGKVFIAAQDSGLHIVGVSNPAAPVLLGTVVTSYANGVGLSKDGTVVISDRDEGLIIFTGGGPFADTVAPGRTNTLAGAPVDSSSIMLTWEAPGDDLFGGTATTYDIRYSTQVITGDNWDSATQATDEPAPSRAGTVESFRVPGLQTATEYYFALRTADEVSNWSGMSNVASAQTASGNVPPVLTNGMVTPDAGGLDETFTFSVTYTDAEGDPPTQAEVMISDQAFTMSSTSNDYAGGVLFEYATTLAIGGYSHSFVFSDGNSAPVVTPTVPGPFVGEITVIGSPITEIGRDTDETQHTVVITREFEVANREVTQAEYEAAMGENPSRHVDPNRPVERVTWLDAVEYCNALSIRDGLTPAYTIDGEAVTWNQEADGWRLPTEAEWEIACRAGTETALANGDLTEAACVDTLADPWAPDPVMDEIGWFCGNAGNSTQEIAQKIPNAEGRYDMHGNVWEWCWDWYIADLGSDAVIDPIGPPGGTQRVVRGGSWFSLAGECRSASRMPYWPSSGDDIVGFRIARTIP